MPTFIHLNDWLAYLNAAQSAPGEMGLEWITKVRDALNLHLNCPIITVGGTNGKGSTCAMLEAILLRAGYQVACYTSPDLLRFNERARLNGVAAADEQLLPHFEAVEQAQQRVPGLLPQGGLSHFEFTTLAVMRLFAASKPDVAILEVGLGGRLDAVNSFDADCAIVCSVELDHIDYLGDTRDKIGFEKAGIFRPGRPAICSDPRPPAALIQHANAIGADLWLIGRDFRCEVLSGSAVSAPQWNYAGRTLKRAALAYPALRGANQLLNASAALAALEALRERLPVSAQDIRFGLASVELPGRFQVLPGRPAVILDVAHNPHAAAMLAHNLGNMGYFPYTYAIFGAMQDKDIVSMIRQAAGEIDHWCVTDLPTPRAARADRLADALRVAGIEHAADHAGCSIRHFASPQKAYADALSRATESDRIVVFGSFHTVAGVMEAHAHCKHRWR